MAQLHDVELDPMQIDSIAQKFGALTLAPDGPVERIAETDRILLLQSDVRAAALERSAQEIRQFAREHVASIYGRSNEKMTVADDGTITRGPADAAPPG